MVTAFIRHNRGYGHGNYFTFPTTPEAFQAALDMEGKPGYTPDQCEIRGISCESVPLLSTYHEYGMRPDEAQYIASKIAALTDEERDAFSAFLESGFAPENQRVKMIMDALENIGAYSLDKTLLTVDDMAKAYIGAGREACSPLLDRMAGSGDQQEGNLMSYIADLEKHFDKAAFVRDILERNDLYITSKGLLAVDWSAFFWRDDREVPEEYRLSAQAGAGPEDVLQSARHEEEPPAAPAGKPSVRSKIRDAAKAPKEPKKEKPPRKKTGPEH